MFSGALKLPSPVQHDKIYTSLFAVYFIYILFSHNYRYYCRCRVGFFLAKDRTTCSTTMDFTGTVDRYLLDSSKNSRKFLFLKKILIELPL